uniref:Z.mays IBP1 initiator-binding protein n=1 Tax=Zea mays TaxID=4577 RepID=V9H122_MAIZE|nr:unnamed protein product [Zea mays]
MNNATTSC